MSPTKGRQDLSSATPPASAPASRAMLWLWDYLSQVRHPLVLDCGPVYQSSLDVLLKRGAKVYVADLITPLQRKEPAFWSQAQKKRVFLVERFLAQIPSIRVESLSVVFSWHLLDLVPHESLPIVIGRLCSYLQPGGVLLCILREPYLANGAQTRWWFENLTVWGSDRGQPAPFQYAAISNREIERLIPGGNVKTFLTRTGHREILGIK